MQSIRRNGFIVNVFLASLLAACGSGENTINGPTFNEQSHSEKAFSTGPVYRFAKISNGAYFYTASAEEKDLIRLNYPDFRYEGVAFNRVTSAGGQTVYRFANLVNGGYFYTASVAERDFVLTDAIQSKRFRLDAATFDVAPDSDLTALPVYRGANRANGAYLYTLSAPELSYAVNVIGTWNDEGTKFRVPNVPTPNASWSTASFASFSNASAPSVFQADTLAATVDETNLFQIGSTRLALTKTATGCSAAASTKCLQKFDGAVIDACIQSSPTEFRTVAVLVSAAAQPATHDELRGKNFKTMVNCTEALIVAATVAADGSFTSVTGTNLTYAQFDQYLGAGLPPVVARAYKINVGGVNKFFIVELQKGYGYGVLFES
jgi:hypothetical protein